MGRYELRFPVNGVPFELINPSSGHHGIQILAGNPGFVWPCFSYWATYYLNNFQEMAGYLSHFQSPLGNESEWTFNSILMAPYTEPEQPPTI